VAKLTKQGVRDLNDLPGKSKGVRLDEPPVPVACKHRNKRERWVWAMRWLYCDDCRTFIGEPW
jgi:hypothetical protein